MIRRSLGLLAGLVWLSTPLFAQAPSTGTSDTPIVQAIRITGASVFPIEELVRRYDLAEGARLPRPPDEIARHIQDRYRAEGFSFATVAVSLDAGTLTITIDEGRFDAVDVTGVDEETRGRILDELAIVPGEVFNASQADSALDEALAFAQGAIERTEPTFSMIADGSRRVLQVALRARHSRSGAFLGTYGREDWYSPVDELNLGFGLHGTVFDRSRFNHTYWSAYVTRKSGPQRFGYAVGVERPFFTGRLLQAGVSIHDLTASDDKWRLGDLEQSLVALAFRNTFRDYYRRKGFQLHAALRPTAGHELLVAWRDDEHQALSNETTFGFFRDDHDFRANAAAQPGVLRSLVLAYTYDSRSFDDLPAERYQRHLLDNLFSDWTNTDEGVRFEWRSELAPSAFSDDFNFTRHVATVRSWWRPAPQRLLSARLMAATSTGMLPMQRVLSLGGIGTVRGYRFKEAAGDGLVLVNGEMRQGVFGRSGIAGLALIDAGRVFAARPGSADGWLAGVGTGIEFPGGSRLEFSWRLDDIPGSLQVLFRLRATF